MTKRAAAVSVQASVWTAVLLWISNYFSTFNAYVLSTRTELCLFKISYWFKPVNCKMLLNFTMFSLSVCACVCVHACLWVGTLSHCNISCCIQYMEQLQCLVCNLYIHFPIFQFIYIFS